MEDFEIPVTIALAVFILAIFVTCCFYNFCSKRSSINVIRGRNVTNNGKITFKQWVKSAVHFHHPLDKSSYWTDVNGTVRTVSNCTMNGKTFTQKAYQTYPNFTKTSSSSTFNRVHSASGKFSSELTTINEEESSYDDSDSDMDTISESTNSIGDRQCNLPTSYLIVWKIIS